MNQGPIEPFPYRSAQALGSALADRLKAQANQSRYSVSQLRRQFAYDRLLTRVFSDPDQQWILKGGVAMLAQMLSIWSAIRDSRNRPEKTTR